jgi:ferredoxin
MINPKARGAIVNPSSRPERPKSQEPTPARRLATLAFDCSAALERSDKVLARQLAEQGFELAARSGDSKWARRFQHLLRVATDQPIRNDPSEYRGPLCSFCQQHAHRIIVGPGAMICTNCVRRCSENTLEGSAIELVVADDMSCTFCGQRSPQEPLFGARGYRLCGHCVQRCVEIARSIESEVSGGESWLVMHTRSTFARSGTE